jgi:SHS2 domain-containing protein
MSFTFFDHTGDVGVRLAGRTLDELFESAAGAFTETITNPAPIEPRRLLSVTLESPALDLLLVDWLSELLYRFELEQFLASAASVHVEQSAGAAPARGAAPSADWRLHAALRGEPFDAGRHAIKVLVKAITYHALEVVEDASGWHATVVFDI